MENLNIQLFAANPNVVIPSVEGRGGRSIDKVWRQSDILARAIQGAIGLEFGNVLTIQEAGVKEENKLYLDSLNGKLYRCKKRTESLVNTTELFELFSIKTSFDRIHNLSESSARHILFENFSGNKETRTGSVLTLSDDIKRFDIVIAEFVCSRDTYMHGFLHGRELIQNTSNRNRYRFTSSNSSGGFVFDIATQHDNNNIVTVVDSNMSWLRVIYAYNFAR